MPHTLSNKGEILAEVIETLSLELDFEKICHYATSITMEILQADLSTLALPAESGPLRFLYFWGFPPDCDTAQLPPVTPGTLMAFASGKTFFVSDYAEYPGALPEFLRLGVQAGFAAPVLLGTQPIGVLTLAWKNPVTAPDDYSRRLVEAVLRQVAFAYQRETLMRDCKRAEQKLMAMNAELELRVRARTAELEASNRELEAFSYSVSHDLRAPLRTISGFSQLVEQDNAAVLNAQARNYLGRIRAAAQRMGELIDGLLELARINRAVTMGNGTTDLSTLAQEIVAELREAEPQRCVDIDIGAGLSVRADRALMRSVLDNLLRNAWKFSALCDRAHIVFDREMRDDGPVFFVRDNGAGFEANAAAALFKPFQRLHNSEMFHGTGLGLATVHRIIERHNGRIWAEGTPGGGATFYFILPGTGQTA